MFRNDPVVVARAFADILRGDRRFTRIVFAIHDTRPGAPAHTVFTRVFHLLGVKIRRGTPAAPPWHDFRMTFIAPAVERKIRPLAADERTMIQAYLDRHRSTLLLKCEGLTGQQLARRAVPPSGMSLLGLIRHLADVERSWVRIRFCGEDTGRIYARADDEDADFNDTDPARAGQDYAALLAEWQACDAAVADASLDDTFFFEHAKAEVSLRCIYLHLIEEYARHNGHADMLREQIDGATGE